MRCSFVEITSLWLVGFGVWVSELWFSAKGADQVQTNPSSQVITKINQLHNLADAGERALCRVRLDGVVCWANASSGELVLQDDSGAIFIESGLKGVCQAGQRVVLEDVCSMGLKRLRRPPVVNNDGLHPPREQSGAVYLKAGRHPITVGWFDSGTDYVLEVDYQGPGIPRQRIPETALFRMVADSINGITNWINGLNYRSFEGPWQQVPDFNSLSPVKAGTVENFNIKVQSRTNNVALEFSGFIELPRDGQYTFYTRSDDGSCLWVGDPSLKIRVIQPKSEVQVRRIVPGTKLTSEQQGQWGVVEGMVRFVSRSVQGTLLDLEFDQARMTVLVRGVDPSSLVRYLNQPTRIVGLAESAMNDQGELVAGKFWTPGLEFISLAQPSTAEWQTLPAYSIRALTAIHTGQPAKKVNQYAITSADDYDVRDPKDWQLLGSNDGGVTWTLLDRRRNEVFPDRFQRRVFTLTNENAFNVYRLQIDANSIAYTNGIIPSYQETIIQVAEIEFMDSSETEKEFQEDTELIATALGDYPPAETKDMAFDGKVKTKWLDHATNSWIQAQYAWINVPSNRVIKVRGRVAQLSAGDSLVLEAKQARILIRSPQSTNLVLGQEIEAAGFLDRQGPQAQLSGAFVQASRDPGLVRSRDQNADAVLLTNIAQVLRLTRDEQTRKFPVHLRGVVTCFIDAGEKAYIETLKTIQDATGAVSMHWGWGGPGQPGDVVEVKGHVDAWARTPVIFISDNTEVLGQGNMPKPAHPSWDALRTGEPENQWIELHGMVYSAENDRFVLKVKGGQVTVRVTPSNASLLKSWVDASVAVRGVYRVVYNKSFQMLSFMLESPGMEYVQVEKPALPDPFSLPTLPVTNLLRADSVDELRHRAKVAGVVTYAGSQFCYVQDNSGVVKARFAGAGQLNAGDRVELVGFPEPGGRVPALAETLVHNKGVASIPVATRLAVEDILKGNHEGQRVQFEAVCLGQSMRGPNQMLEVLADRHIFRALLHTNQGRLFSVPADSKIDLAGVCWIESESGRQPGQSISSFDLLLNDPSDVVILERPPWWTWKHTVGIVGLMGVILGGAVAWIRTLRHKVNERTLALKQEIEEHKRTETRLEEKTLLLEDEIEERKQLEAEKERIHKELLTTSRQAGMAEVATGVLHNIGNVLNSVNVSATLIAEKIKNSRTASVTKTASLIQEHAGDLGRFFSEDARGKQLPDYLCKLSQHLAQEQQGLLEEFESVRQHIDHIKQIVVMQQNYAKASGMIETLEVSTLVEDALRIHSGAYVRHSVQVERNYAHLPNVSTDKHKVLQILVNLFHNAKYACDETSRPDKQVVIRTLQSGDDRVKIEVADNGIGISPENLTKIFMHGFTTRKGGHGFGLHSGAIAAKELGGTLTAHSDGTGKGATFTLELPLVSPQNQPKEKTAS